MNAAAARQKGDDSSLPPPMMTTSEWQVGQIVQVQARTWPGINQPGGVGRITGCNSDGTRIAVRYVLDGRHEKEIDVTYVEPYGNTDDSNRLRDRSMLLGRCRVCGSLRSDCGSCDLRQEQEAWRRAAQRKSHQDSLWRIFQHKKSSPNNNNDDDDDDEDENDDEDSTEEIFQSLKRLDDQSRKFKRIWKKAKLYSTQNDGNDDDSSINETSKPTTAESNVPNGKENVKNQFPCTPQKEDESSVIFVGSPDFSPTNDDSKVATSDEEESNSSSSDDSIIFRTLVRGRRRNRLLNHHKFASPLGKSQRETVHASTCQSPLDKKSPSQSPLPGTQQNDDDDDKLFIQPEGNVENLPADVKDETSGVPYVELPEFCDRIVKQLEQEGLPAARRQLVQLERKAATVPAVLSEDELEDVYADWISRFIRRGIDQCHLALRKITRQYRQHKAVVPAGRRHEFRGTRLDLREARVDQLSDSVEELIARLKQLFRRVGGRENDDDAGSIVNDDDDGWADPSASSPVHPVDPTDPVPTELRALGDWDPHMHANRRKPTATRQGRFVPNRDYRRGNRKRTISKQPRKSVEQKPPTPDVNREMVQTNDGNGDSFIAAHDDDENDVDANDENSRLFDPAPESPDDGGTKRSLIVHNDTSENESTVVAAKRPRRTTRQASRTAAQRPEAPGLTDFFAMPDDLDRGTAPDQEPVAKRMERFLKANDIDEYDEMDVESPTFSRVHTPKKGRQRRKKRQTTVYESFDLVDRNTGSEISRRRQAKRGHRRDYCSDKDATSETGRASLQSRVFSELRSSRHGSSSGTRNSTSRQENLFNPADMTMVATNLVEEFGSPSCRGALMRLSSFCRSEYFSTSLDAPEILSNLLACLQKRGTDSLQYFLALRPRELPNIVMLHVALLDAMKGLDQTNRASIGDTMGPVVPSDYVDFVVLQMVDSILSLLLPKAWGLSINDPSRYLVQFENLRRALGAHCNLLESCSKCVMDRLPSQTWRLTLDETNAFISCVDPQDWTRFLERGTVDYKTDESKLRYSSFKSNLPRSEADALWTLLGFVGLESIQTDQAAPSARRLISSLFSRGSLFTVPNESCLPPSASQVEACADELQNITSLLKAKAVDGSTMKDSFLANLIKQAVILGADFVSNVEEARIALFPAFDKNSNDWNRIKLLRKRFDAYTRNPGDTLRPLESFDPETLFATRSRFLGQEEYLPSSLIIQRTSELFIQWFRTIPAKRVRLANFEKSKNSLVSQFKELAKDTSNLSMDAFQQAFSTYTPAQSGQGGQRRNIFLLEAASYLEIFHALSVSSTKVPQGVRKVEGLVLLKKVWNLLADKEMIFLIEQTGSLPSVSSRDPYLLCVCARVMAFVGLLVEGIWPTETDDESLSVVPKPIIPVEDKYATSDFVLNCLVACFELASNSSSKSVEVISFVCQRIVVYLDLVAKARRDRAPESQHRIVFSDAHLDKLDYLCKSCIQSLISSSYCGSIEEICFCLNLLLADFVSSTRISKITKTESPAIDNDEWGGLDDSLFASIDVPVSQNDNAGSLDLILSKALQDSTPTMTYAVHADARQAITSVQGRLLIGRRVKWMARSLALRMAVSCEDRVSQILSRFWKVALRLSDGGNGAKELSYFRNVSFSLAGESCQLWKLSSFDRKTLKTSSTTLVLKALEQILESSAISRLPSRDLAAAVLRNGAGPNATGARELVLYKDLQKGRLESARKKSGRAWFVSSVIANFEEMLNECTSVLDAFREGFAMRSELELEMEPCMEHELIHRLHFVFNVLRLSKNESDFETLSAAAIGVVSLEVTFLLHTYKPTENSSPSYEDTKGRFVLATYGKLLGAVVLHVLLVGTARKLITERLKSHILLECLIPLLAKRRTMVEVMQKNCHFADSVLYGDFASHVPSVESRNASNSDDSCVDGMRERSSQIVMWAFRQFLVGDKQVADDLLNALFLSVVCPVTASTVARGLFYNFGSLDRMDSATGSDFSGNLQTLLVSFVPDQYKPRDSNSAMNGFFDHILEKMLAGKLRRHYLDPAVRLRQLRLLEAILGQMRITNSTESRFTTNPTVLASIGNSILISIWCALSSGEVNRDIIETSLLCASTLFGLPSGVLGEAEFGWITDWCEKHEGSNSDASEDEEREYLHLVSSLCSTICDCLEDQRESSVRDFTDYRKILAESGAGCWAPFRRMDIEKVNSIKFLEKMLGYAQSATSKQIKNVYAACKHSSEMADFQADEKILAAVQRFRNEIRRL